jgi:hypothetical protein
MSDFCIYPHSGIPQGLKGLILVGNPLRETWFKILPSGGATLPPSLGHVTRTAIDQYHSNLIGLGRGGRGLRTTPFGKKSLKLTMKFRSPEFFLKIDHENLEFLTKQPPICKSWLRL